MTDKQFTELTEMLQLKKNKSGMYVTAWGNKTDIGLKASIERIAEVPITDAEHPVRLIAVSLLEALSAKLGNEDIFDNAKGKHNTKPDGTWYEYEDLVVSILRGGAGYE